jgi:catechol 2,3-dioxygenase-like lactoylglutathione lyase family enzyme
MTPWTAKLTDIVLTAEEPAAAAAYWAGLLGGVAWETEVALAGDTRIAVRRGPRAGLAEAGFQASPELVAAARATGAPELHGAAGIVDPDGWRLRLDEVPEIVPLVLEGPTLSHCTLNSPDPNAQRRFYETLGFRLSDALGDVFSWLRCNPIHHSMAFSRHEVVAIHHLAIELPDRAAFIGAIDRVIAAGAKLEFGPGRHMVGGNLFAYFRDAHGLRWELCCEMGRIDDPDHVPVPLTAKDRGRSVNTFGPPPPESFIQEAGGPIMATADAR